MAYAENLSHENGGPNTLYIHPVSGNALGAALYVKEKNLDIKVHFIDIMAGEQNADWFLALNPNHAIPTLATADGSGVWESGAVLRHLAKLAGEEVDDHSTMAMEWRQSSASKFFGGIYGPHLFGFPGDLDAGVAEFKEKVEPLLVSFFLKSKFMGGDKPSIADYHWVPVITMFTSSPYWAIADERIKTWVKDFQDAVGCWEEVGAMQTGMVASKA
eukprot:TRINITY_DN4220_c0_g1_i1.p2 TRINITY_DN4220_c0_g1~~TRINITY_DN4220_c0_g1_i1.p2  ORF type:complete len:216 (-),score=62.99 TRINITY_DN4220_c0_g1_i1:219-866(-)